MKRLIITFISLFVIASLFTACQQDPSVLGEGDRIALTVAAASIEGNTNSRTGNIPTRAVKDGVVVTGFSTGDVIKMELTGTIARTVYVHAEDGDLWGLYTDTDCTDPITDCYVDPLDVTVAGSFAAEDDVVKTVPETSVYSDQLVASGTGVGIRAGVDESFGKLVVEFYFQHGRALITTAVQTADQVAVDPSVLIAHITDAQGVERDLSLTDDQTIAPNGARLTGFTVNQEKVILTDAVDLEANYKYPFKITYTPDGKLQIKLSGSGITDWTTGTGTVNMGYDHLISSAQDLRDFRDAVNSGTTVTALQTANITLETDGQDANWVPIGTSDVPFEGTYNGNGFTITGLQSETEQAGLFGTLNGAILYNIHLRDVEITAEAAASPAYTGAIAAVSENNSLIALCSATGQVKANSGTMEAYAGGLIGRMINSNLSRSRSGCQVEAVSTNGEAYAGGVAGQVDNSLLGLSMSSGNVTSNAVASSAYAGELGGQLKNTSRVFYSYTTGSTAASGTGTFTGGLVGEKGSSEVTGCYANGESADNVRDGSVQVETVIPDPNNPLSGILISTRIFNGDDVWTSDTYPTINYNYEGVNP